MAENAITTNATMLPDADYSGASFFLNEVYLPMISCIGLLGNCCSFLLLRQPQYRHQLSALYIRMITVFDCITLLMNFELLIILKVPEVTQYHPTFVCIQHIYVYYTAYDMSVWTLSLFSIDRFIATVWPLQASKYCTKTRAKIAISSVLTFFILFYIPNVFRKYDTSTNAAFNCPFDSSYLPEWYSEFFSIADTLFFIGFPFMIILTANSGIAIALMIRRANKKKLGSTSEGNQDRTVLLMLLLLTIIYISTNLPYALYAYLIEVLYKDALTPATETLIHEIATQAWVTNSALNFYALCLGCKRYRIDLLKMFRGWFGVKSKAASKPIDKPAASNPSLKIRS